MPDSYQTSVSYLVHTLLAELDEDAFYMTHHIIMIIINESVTKDSPSTNKAEPCTTRNTLFKVQILSIHMHQYGSDYVSNSDTRSHQQSTD